MVDASGLEVDPLNEEWPSFAHPKRPEFLLTRPDRDRTSGFFIARMKRPHRPSQHGLTRSASQASALGSAA